MVRTGVEKVKSDKIKIDKYRVVPENGDWGFMEWNVLTTGGPVWRDGES
jgi:hypothetical protein